MSGHGHGYGYGRQREARRRRLLARLVAVVDEMLLDVEERTVAASEAGTLRPSSCCEACRVEPGTVDTSDGGTLCRGCWKRWAAGRVEHTGGPGLALVDALAPDVLPAEIAVEEEGDGAS